VLVVVHFRLLYTLGGVSIVRVWKRQWLDEDLKHGGGGRGGEEEGGRRRRNVLIHRSRDNATKETILEEMRRVIVAFFGPPHLV
jgi:hypothetical protein